MELGWDSDLVVEPDGDQPTPSGDQVTIEVEACGVCGRDCIDRAGRFAFLQVPITPGHEAAGRVVAVGPDVTDWRVGDRVGTTHYADGAILGLTIDGGYATWLTAPQACFYAVPDDIDPALAAIFHCTLGTAWRGLHRAGLDRSSRVLVTGANGGVGAAALQICQGVGATSIAVVRREEDVEFVTAMGADDVLVDDGSTFHKHLPGGQVDIAMECVGAPTFNAALRSLIPGGRLVAIGNITGERIELNIGYVITLGLHILGSTGATREDMANLFDLNARQPLNVPIHDRLPLAEADRAQRMVAAGGLRGRVVVVP